MKTAPINNYKKPRYAAAILSLLATTGALCGCTENESIVYSQGGKSGESEIQLGGDEYINPDLSSEVKGEMSTPSDISEIQVDGQIAPYFPEETFVTLEGDVAVIGDESETELATAGVLPAPADTDDVISDSKPVYDNDIGYDGGMTVDTDYPDDTAVPENVSE